LHAKRNALIPVMTVAGMMIIGMLGGVMITETVFTYPGLGFWAAKAAQQLDYGSVISFALLFASIMVLGNLVVDISYALIVFGWMGYARVIRGNILSAKEETYVMAAKALGVKDGKVIWKHLLPNTIFPVLVQASMNIGSMVITAA
ncbi:unnamed protein product, partial [marine sediment metagenome]